MGRVTLQNTLRTADHEKAFVTRDGDRLHTILHLIDELQQMDDQTYSHHVTELKNDFANWVEHVFEHNSLAERMRRSRSRHTMIELLKEEYRFAKEHHTTPTRKVDEDIAFLEEDLDHILNYSQDVDATTEPLSKNALKEKLVDFAFGFIIGLLAGLLLGKSFGLY